VLVTRQPVLRRFWYPAMPEAMLAGGPRPFRMFGRDLVLWRTAGGRFAAMADRCCHRTARLSRGWIDGETLVCGYHGWTYDCAGKCVRIPQAEAAPPAGARVETFRCEARYGYAWVCLGEPLAPIPELPEDGQPGYRRIHEFYETWRCAGLRIMENGFDNAHFAFVHKTSFGRRDDPTVDAGTITPTDYGFVYESVMPVVNPDIQRKNLGMASRDTKRIMRKHWYLPFARKLELGYPNGLVHAIVGVATPIDDSTVQWCQWCYRNDTEADAPAAGVIAFDRQVTDEDRAILEATDWDVPLEVYTGEERSMPSDRPGIEMRKRLAALLAAHGETEVRRQPARAAA
jgi:phenylpropionate dioxygenase-like ring-hydroxylating dioxygenase large terminal subunit